MSFEGNYGGPGGMVSPGGFEFGIQGFTYAEPVPKSITFFLDGSALVADQYGKPIKGVLMPDGTVVIFADSPPLANETGALVPRPQFASHAQVIAALTAEGINWLEYSVWYRQLDGTRKVRARMTKEAAEKLVIQLSKEPNAKPVMGRTIVSAGWPQISYEELKKLPEVPPTPEEELRKIRDPKARQDALRFRREVDESMKEQMAEVE